MKRFVYFMLIVAAMLTACEREDYEHSTPTSPALYLNVAAEQTSANIFVKRVDTQRVKTLNVQLSGPVANDVVATLSLAPDKVALYNQKHNTDYAMLDAEHIEILDKQLTIKAGNVTSQSTQVIFKGLEQLPQDVTFLAPLSITSSDVALLTGSSTIWYLVKQTTEVTTAGIIKGLNCIEFPTLNVKGPQSAMYNGLQALTFEMLIKVQNFRPEGMEDLSYLIGVEQYLQFRIGDKSFPRQQLQVQVGGAKFPEADDTKSLEPNVWYHVAMTYDIQTSRMIFYVNGDVQSEGQVTWGGSAIDLAMKGKWDAEPEKYPALKEAREFYIGNGFDYMTRPLEGEIAEVRVWNKVRSRQELSTSMFDVDPQTEGLLGYWKFDTPEDGQLIKDMTGHGNDGHARLPLPYDQGVKIPKLNEK